MRTALSVVNSALKAIVWGLLIILGAGVALLVMTTFTIIIQIDRLNAFVFLGYVLLIIYWVFYYPKS